MSKKQKPQEDEQAPEELAREGNIITLSLPTPLTQEQQAEYGTRAGELQLALNKIAERKAAYVDKCKLEAEPLQEELDDLLQKLGDGEEKHEVKCELMFDLDSNMACYRRLDTGEIAHTRAIEAHELEAARQGTLPGV